MRLRIYPYKEIAINSAFLEIPAEYQRKLQMGKVKQMVAEFNGIIVNPPKVSYRDGRYIVIDGQHTIVGLKTLNGGNDLPILCRVYVGLTKEEEALVFAQQTGASTPLSAGCVAGPRPADEAGEAEQGLRSAFCKPAVRQKKSRTFQTRNVLPSIHSFFKLGTSFRAHPFYFENQISNQKLVLEIYTFKRKIKYRSAESQYHKNRIDCVKQ